VFSYVLLQGYKYQTTGLVATRKIAEEGDMNCLEFYDPYTGQTSPQLASEENLRTLTDTIQQLLAEKRQLQPFLSSADTLSDFEEKRIEQIDREIEKTQQFINTLASNAQINSTSRYFADFNITIEPSVKIVEIPLEEKTMRIVDHPPNDFNVSPYHLQDQSNRLAFYLKYDTFSADTEPYPNTITATDERNEASYKEGKDFVPGSLTKEESVSAARFIEVYRMMEKPTSYQSFENNLRTTIDLKSEAGDIASDHFFIERVRENVKYYYTFRAVNENGVAGQLSPIFESELINDGGYVYGLFNQLSEDELVEPPPKSPILAIKNLLNVVPNIQHLQLDTSGADFTNNSVDEIGLVELGTGEGFWNEKFKIRLTSKKTGRKLDLNLTFEKKQK
jgi:DNA-binding ferritin-like protein